MKMSDAELIKAFMSGATHREIAEEYGLNTHYVAVRLGRLRKAGVNLPKREFATKKKEPVNVELLNNLVDKLSGDKE